ncbi:MAG: sigma-54-dependent Fis family transcriptional regulator [Chromatiales bacterium]|nr:sigma-54-dependent Fis family transcriptional regulator [Chromatiales bacterium]
MSAPVLLVEDDAHLREALADTLRRAGFAVQLAASGAQALEFLAAQKVGLVLTDVRMPGMTGQSLLKHIAEHHPGLSVLMMTAYGSVDGAVNAMRAGAVDYLEKPFKPAELIARVRRFIGVPDATDASLVAYDPAIREVLDLAARVARTNVTAMVSGESGTGKEVVARYIHANSARADGPFVAINCAAIPENLLEATLFGHERGAFTGAHQGRSGKFEQAEGGTLLLDEVTEMDIGLQAKFLRVIQEREVERVGGSHPIAVDIRLIATTNRELRGEVEAGRFREDLYYRLNVVRIHLPPLRDRPADIVPLARTLLRRAAQLMEREVPGISGAAELKLCKHSWPGNVRELDNLMQRALVLQPGVMIDAVDLAFESVPELALGAYDHEVDDEPSCNDLRAHEQRVILDALADLGGNRQRVATQLGISPRTLRYKLARMREDGIEVPGARQA